MRPLTDTRPKPLAELAGKPLIQYHVERLAAAGVERVVINVAWLGSQIRDTLGDGQKFGLRLLYSDEGPVPLETGGGIVQALPLLGDDPFWVVSADLWTDFAFNCAERALAPSDLAHLLMVANPPYHLKGDFHLQNGRISPTTGTRLTYGNLALFRPALFAGCLPGRYPMVPILRAAIDRGSVSGELFAGRWHNIGTVAQLQALDVDLRLNKQ
jgi:MurNAc alpha-1-phosphate uridylyltransferase